ncbi:hypothetical protein JMJ35_001879 [Cladonia borealis]|uniref:Uncharacterized protein n=1 Tax=Cladonia borealis TaxID=184061 RepID=A0AA39R6Q0_9LECA|nr:hypothetical protein JMJ35_001879 [Cladonia borealis]
MSQTPSQDPLDLIQTNDANHNATNTSRLPSPNPTPTQEQPLSNSQPQTVSHEPLSDFSPQPRSSSLPAPSSKTNISSKAPTSTNPIPNGPNIQPNQTQLPPQEDLDNSKDPLEAYDWAELEERFHAEMERCGLREDAIQVEFNELLKLFKTWTATGSMHEENRAGKRLRTRITYVQQREQTLEEKRTHYVKVVKAFESALALLGGP